MSKRYLTRVEYNLILAGLECLAQVRDECSGDLPEDLEEMLKEGVDEDDEEAQDELDELSQTVDELVSAITNREVQMMVEGTT